MQEYKPGTKQNKGERIAKIMARAGLCSRRQAESWIAAGRVKLNGKVLKTPAVTVSDKDHILVDDTPLKPKERTRLWLYHKPAGLVTTSNDPEGRKTVFAALPDWLPRVISVGRLDINTEGLLLLTNDGGLARALELPQTGWLRRYRVRAHQDRSNPDAKKPVSQTDFDRLKDGIAVDGVLYGSIDAQIDRQQGANLWLTMALREGKNREVKQVLGALGLVVNRLIRVSYGPFQLGELAPGEISEIRGRILRDQLGQKLIAQAGADFDAPIHSQKPSEKRSEKIGQQKKPAGKRPARNRSKNPLDRLSTKATEKIKSSGPSKPRTKNRKTGKQNADR